MNSMQEVAFARRFRFWSVLTVISIYLLILVGGVVRATGSGMGCPDWPKCFGQWVPPTQADQLPVDYKQVYTAQRVAKNQKLARTLARLGFKQVAGEIFAHPTQYIETDFNATKTWIEYINRLLGALIGIFVFVTAAVAWPYWQRDRLVFWLALASWLLTGFQGWLGSLVVSTNLLPVMVTIHMGLALLIVALLLYAAHRARWNRAEQESKQQLVLEIFNGQDDEAVAITTGLRWLLWGALILTFGQIILGTQVREEIDQIAATAGYAQRATWIDKLSSVFESHRTLSAIVVLVNVYIGYQLWQLAMPALKRFVLTIWAVLGLEMIAGIMLAYFALPAWVQPVHLTLATMLFGAQFITLLVMQRLARLGVRPVVVATTTTVNYPR